MITILKEKSKKQNSFHFTKQNLGLPLAVLTLVILLLLPLPHGLTRIGYNLLAVLSFMIIIWVTECFSYAVSAIYLIAAMALTIGLIPSHGKILGTSKGLIMALSGFGTGAWILSVAAIFIASAIQATGLGQRIGMFILSIFGAKTKRVLLSFILMSFVLTFFVPAQIATATLMNAIALGVINTFGLQPKGNMAKSIMLAVGFGPGISGMGFLTSGAPAIQTAKLISDTTKHNISWFEWAMYGLPYAVTIALVLYFLLLIFFPHELAELKGGKTLINEQLRNFGKLSEAERNLLIIMLITILLWVTGGHLHPIDNSTIALFALIAILLPPLKIGSWKQLSQTVDWGMLMLFGSSISLGTCLLQNGVATWVAKNTIIAAGVPHWPLFWIIAIGSLFFAIISLAFSARTSAVAALIPTAIAFAGLLNSNINIWGLTLIFYYSIQFPAMIPANTPGTLIAYASDTFTSWDMMKIALILIPVAVLLAVLFSFTYWSWLGLLKI